MNRPLVVGLLLLLATPAWAQQIIPQRLSLDEAQRIAREHNPAYRGSFAGVAAARADTRRSRGAFLPELDAVAGYNATTSRTLVGVDPFGQSLASDSAIVFTNSYVSQGLRLSVPVFQGGQRVSELRAARAGERAAVAGTEAEANRLHAEVARRYYTTLEAERLIALEERLLASARERLAAVLALLRVAASDPADVLGAEAEVAQQELAVSRARSEARKAKLALREILGVSGEAALVLTTEPPIPFDPAVLPADSLVAIAEAGRPRVVQARASTVAADARVSAARRQRWPTLSADLAFGRSARVGGYGALGDFFTPSDRALTLGFFGSLPIFNGWQTAAAIGRANADRMRADEELRAERLAAEREVRTALVDLEQAYTATELAGRAAALAQKRLELAQQKYRLGAISFTDLQTVTDQAARAERAALDARFDFATALATLEETVGAPVRP